MKIKVYSTPSCMWCSFLKQYLESKDITYEDVDVSKDRLAALEMIRKSGQRGVPVIDIDGNIIVGFDRYTLDQMINAY